MYALVATGSHNDRMYVCVSVCVWECVMYVCGRM